MMQASRRGWTALVAAVAAAGLLSGCGGISSGTSSNGGVSISGDGTNGADGTSIGVGVPGNNFSYSYAGPDGVTGSGKLTSRMIDLSGVTSVVAGANFEVRLKTGGPAQAKVTMDDNLVDLVEATVAGNELRLGVKPGKSISNATLSADVTVGQLDRLTANGASRVTLNPALASPALQLGVAGASAVTGPVTVGQMQATISGSPTLTLSGQVQDLRLDVMGASQLPLADLTVRHLDTTLSGANHVTITVSDTLSAEAIGASVLQYRGNPQIIRQQTLGVSSIEQDPS